MPYIFNNDEKTQTFCAHAKTNENVYYVFQLSDQQKIFNNSSFSYQTSDVTTEIGPPRAARVRGGKLKSAD